MPLPTDNPALFAAAGCGCHQQVFGTLPDGTIPDIFMDFKNGIYQSQGEDVALNTLLTENADWGTWNPATMISPGVGITVVSGIPSPVFTGEAFDLAASGATIVLVFSGTTTAATARSIRYELVDDLVEYNLNYYSRSSFRDGDVSRIGDQTADDVNDGVLATGAHKTAITMIDGKISRSTDGAAIISIDPAAPWSPAPTVMGFIVRATVVLESVGIYPAQPDADLPMLSAP